MSVKQVHTRSVSSSTFFLRMSDTRDSTDISDHDDSKNCFLETFCDPTDVIEYVIARERNDSVKQKGIHHLQIYFKTVHKYLLPELSKIIRDVFPFCNIDLQGAKSVKNICVYLSKEDVNLLTNISHSRLSFYFQLYWWCKRNQTFNVLDPFIVKHYNKCKFMERFYNELKLSVKPSFCGFSQFIDGFDVNWVREVCDWWNDWVVNGWTFKKKQLYLYGDPDNGKTSFVKRLFSDINSKYIFTPSFGPFGWEGLQPFHRLIFVDDYKPLELDQRIFRLVLQGSDVMVNCKGIPSKRITFRGPIIVTSNYSCDDPPLLARFRIINSEKRFYDCEECLFRKYDWPTVISLDETDEAYEDSSTCAQAPSSSHSQVEKVAEE